MTKKNLQEHYCMDRRESKLEKDEWDDWKLTPTDEAFFNGPGYTNMCNELAIEALKKVTVESTNPKDLEGNKKPPLSLVPPSVLIHLAEAFKEGAKKYGAYNWRTKKVQSMIYLDAALRHIMAVVDGEDIDPESGKHHLDGALASLAVYVDAMETGNLVDNRPPKGVAGALIRKISGKDL